VPLGQCDVPSFASCAQPVFTPAVQRSKKPLFTLTGFFLESNDMLSGMPLLKPCADRYAMKPSLKGEQMYAGHSPE
jgi:hypothetical protein